MHNSSRNNDSFCVGPMLLLATFVLLGAASAAQAHSVSLWANVEKGHVYVEAYFSDGAKVQDGTIFVIDAKGEKLLEGKTDKEGKFDFIPAVKEEMTILLRLGGGHEAKFKLEVKDFAEEEKKEKEPAKSPESSGEKD